MSKCQMILDIHENVSSSWSIETASLETTVSSAMRYLMTGLKVMKSMSSGTNWKKLKRIVNGICGRWIFQVKLIQLGVQREI